MNTSSMIIEIIENQEIKDLAFYGKEVETNIVTVYDGGDFFLNIQCTCNGGSKKHTIGVCGEGKTFESALENLYNEFKLNFQL